MRSLILGSVASILLTTAVYAEPVTPVIPIIVVPSTTEATSVLPKVETEPCPSHLSTVDELLDDRCWNYPAVASQTTVPLMTPVTVYGSQPRALWAFNYRDEEWPGDDSYKVWDQDTWAHCESDRLGMPADKVSTSACVYTRAYSLAK